MLKIPSMVWSVLEDGRDPVYFEKREEARKYRATLKSQGFKTRLRKEFVSFVRGSFVS